MIVAVLLAVLVVYLGICTVAGFGPPGPLHRFEPDAGPLVRYFAAPTEAVVSAYRTAVDATAGMVVAEAAHHVLLIDARPTMRIIDGNFGMLLRLHFTDQGNDADVCRVTVEMMKKVPFAVASSNASAFRQAERALRMNAKRHGIQEMLTPA